VPDEQERRRGEHLPGRARGRPCSAALRSCGSERCEEDARRSPRPEGNRDDLGDEQREHGEDHDRRKHPRGDQRRRGAIRRARAFGATRVLAFSLGHGDEYDAEPRLPPHRSPWCATTPPCLRRAGRSARRARSSPSRRRAPSCRSGRWGRSSRSGRSGAPARCSPWDPSPRSARRSRPGRAGRSCPTARWAACRLRTGGPRPSSRGSRRCRRSSCAGSRWRSGWRSRRRTSWA